MRKNKKRLAVLMTLLLITGFLSYFDIFPDFNRARVQNKKKSCVANMKTIEGAVELYCMENPGAKSLRGPFNIEWLLKKDKPGPYLKSEPKCPSNVSDRYEIKMIEMPPNNNSDPWMTDVSCRIHGDLSRQETDHRLMGVPPPTLQERLMAFFFMNNGYGFPRFERVLFVLILAAVLFEMFMFSTRRRD